MNNNTIVNSAYPKVVHKKKKNIGLNILYYTSGVILALLFLFPVLYMLAASTKSEAQCALDAGTINMFLPSLNFNQMLENYSVIFIKYDVWKYFLNSMIYAVISIILNILIHLIISLYLQLYILMDFLQLAL